jgi:hypothetical protein
MRTQASKTNLHLMCFILAAFALLAAQLTHAGEADVMQVKAKRNVDGTFRFDITVKSKDTGWDYYAE